MDPEPLVGELEGYRSFLVLGRELRSYAARYVWRPGPNVATCTQARPPKRTRVFRNAPDGSGLVEVEVEEPGHGLIPDPSCGCGFWAYRFEYLARQKGPGPLGVGTGAASYGSFGGDLKGLVLGRVKLWGRVLEGEDGWRAEKARITALVSDDPAVLAPVAEAYGVEVVPPRTKREEGVFEGWITRLAPGPAGLEVRVFPKSREDLDAIYVAPPGSAAALELHRLGPGAVVRLLYAEEAGGPVITGVEELHLEDEES